jgi:hypothetical protein
MPDPRCVTSANFVQEVLKIKADRANGNKSEIRVVDFRRDEVSEVRFLTIFLGAELRAGHAAEPGDSRALRGNVAEILMGIPYTETVTPVTCGVNCPTDGQRNIEEDEEEEDAAVTITALPMKLTPELIAKFDELTKGLAVWTSESPLV